MKKRDNDLTELRRSMVNVKKTFSNFHASHQKYTIPEILENQKYDWINHRVQTFQVEVRKEQSSDLTD